MYMGVFVERFYIRKCFWEMNYLNLIMSLQITLFDVKLNFITELGVFSLVYALPIFVCDQNVKKNVFFTRFSNVYQELAFEKCNLVFF